MPTNYPPHYAYPSAPTLIRVMPKPPGLHWGWVLALNLLTRGLFGAIWLLVQANWVRKVRGKSTAFVLSICHVCIFPFIFVAALIVGILGGVLGVDIQNGILPAFTVGVVVLILVFYFATVYTLRSELESSPIEIPLGGIATFFFGTIYFQYHLHDYELPYAVEDTAGIVSQPVILVPSDGGGMVPPSLG